MSSALLADNYQHVKINQHLEDTQKSKEIETINVTGVRRRLTQTGVLQDSIAKTEVLTQAYIDNSQSASLADAIQNAIGIRLSNECSMCGAKRIMINGMKGEHTNVLIDGIPMHTMISGFYGMDSVAASGIGSIEIARGAGASLTSPEAIGGTVNLISKNINKDILELDLSSGELGYTKTSLVAGMVSNNGDTSATIIAQYDARDQFDGDNNGVSESPFLENKSAVINFSHDFSYVDNFRFRYNQVESEVFGGPMLGQTTSTISSALESVNNGSSAALFVDNDLRNLYLGQPWQTSEWVNTDRKELSSTWLHEFAGNFNLTTSVAYIEHEQDSFYEGVDYFAKDTMYYASMRFNFDVNNEHLFTFGSDYRHERMRSKSNVLEGLDNFVSDSFNYITQGVYFQETWTPTENFELAAALRIDNIKADFTDPTKPGTEINETLWSPRVDMRYLHNEQFISRLSFGQGYRAPLSFFESDHGILDAGKGFLVEVDRPERSYSFTYSLNYDADKLSSTFSIAHTAVDYLASLSENAQLIPVLSQLQGTAKVTAIDLSLNYQIIDQWSLAAVIEQYHYNSVFKSSFTIAPAEQRASLSSNWDHKGWKVITSATWVASKDLSEYGYQGYNRADGTDKKSTLAGAYTLVDLKIVKAITDKLSLYFGATNLFNYSQASNMESPLMFDQEGGYDVVYIYGPLRGRMAYTGISYDF